MAPNFTTYRRNLGTLELSLLMAARGSAGGRQLRRDLPPALGQGGHGFVQAALKPSWEDPLHSWGLFCGETLSANRFGHRPCALQWCLHSVLG